MILPWDERRRPAAAIPNRVGVDVDELNDLPFKINEGNSPARDRGVWPAVPTCHPGGASRSTCDIGVVQRSKYLRDTSSSNTSTISCPLAYALRMALRCDSVHAISPARYAWGGKSKRCHE